MLFKIFSHNISLMGTQDILLAQSYDITWDIGEDDIDVHVNEVISVSHVDHELGLTFKIYVRLNFIYGEADE